MDGTAGTHSWIYRWGKARGRTILLVTWALLCLCVFIVYPGSRSVLHGSSLDKLFLLGPKLARIDAWIYVVDLIKAFGGILIFSAACLGMGLAPLARFWDKIGTRTTSEIQWLAKLGTAILVGQGLLSAIFLTLAEAGLLQPILVGSILAIAIGVGAYTLWRYVPIHPPPRAPGARARWDLDHILITIPAMVVLALTLLYSSSRLSYDAVALYFSDAKATALAHSVRYFMDDSFVASIFHTGIMYSALSQLFGDQAARMYSWFGGLLLILFGLALMDSLGFSHKSLVVMLVLVLSSTAIVDLMGDGKIDLPSAAPALAAIYWLVVASGRASASTSALIGFLAGQSVAARPFNLFLVGAVVVAFLLQMALRGTPAVRRPKVTPLGTTALWIGIGAAPWLAYHVASNWMILGDPFSFVRDIVGVAPDRWQWALPPSQLWFYRLIYPVVVSIFNTPQSLGNISPAFLGFLPLLYRGLGDASPQRAQAYRSLIVAGLITLVAWILLTFMIFEIRYVTVMWMILFIPSSVQLAGALTDPDPVLRNTVRLFLATLMAFMILRTTYISLDTYSPIDSTGNAHCSGLRMCDFLQPINDEAHPGDRVLTLAAFRYYLRQDLFACSTSHSEYTSLKGLIETDPSSFWTQVYRDGYRFVAYEWNYTKRHLYYDAAPDPSNTPTWMRLQAVSGEPGDAEVAYRILVTNPPVEIDKACVLRNGIWTVEEVSDASQ